MTQDKDKKTDAQLEKDIAEAQQTIDEARGYKRRVLANGQVDYEALHDHWTSPNELTMQEHVEGFKSKMSGYLNDPAIIITNQ